MEAEMVYVAGDYQIVQDDHSGGRLDWSNMTSDRGYWSDAAPNHQKTYFHI